MEVKIIENKADKLKFGVFGVDHVLMNLLVEQLTKDKDVVFSTYSEPHPLLDGFEVTVRGKDPISSVEKAIAAAGKDIKEIESALAKAK
jgi:DNA-directed RNA polymerase subunit L